MYSSTNTVHKAARTVFQPIPTTTENYCYCQTITMVIKMTPTHGLLHGFQHKNDSMTLTLPPLQEEMHFSGTANGQKAAKHLFFTNEQQQKDETVHIEQGGFFLA